MSTLNLLSEQSELLSTQLDILLIRWRSLLEAFADCIWIPTSSNFFEPFTSTSVQGILLFWFQVECLKWLPEFIADAEIHKRMTVFHKVMVARKKRQAAVDKADEANSEVKNTSKENNVFNKNCLN